MQEFFSALSSPGSWNQTQWLAVSIGLFVLVASFYFVYRLYRIIREAGKSGYQPNIGRSRLRKAARGGINDGAEPAGKVGSGAGPTGEMGSGIGPTGEMGSGAKSE